MGVPITGGRVGNFSGFAVVSPERRRENEELRTEIALVHFVISLPRILLRFRKRKRGGSALRG